MYAVPFRVNGNRINSYRWVNQFRLIGKEDTYSLVVHTEVSMDEGQQHVLRLEQLRNIIDCAHPTRGRGIRVMGIFLYYYFLSFPTGAWRAVTLGFPSPIQPEMQFQQVQHFGH